MHPHSTDDYRPPGARRRNEHGEKVRNIGRICIEPIQLLNDCEHFCCSMVGVARGLVYAPQASQLAAAQNANHASEP
jgi:hypothetical protein